VTKFTAVAVVIVIIVTLRDEGTLPGLQGVDQQVQRASTDSLKRNPTLQEFSRFGRFTAPVTSANASDFPAGEQQL
jgi:hypothetical protein